MMSLYNSHIETLYDELSMVGEIGRGTHYSVLRAMVWHNEASQPLSRAEYHDFAIIWDEDHDQRVMLVVDELHRNGFLSAFKFIGEQKGILTAIMDKKAADHLPGARALIEQITQMLPDPWTSYVYVENSDPDIVFIVSDETAKVRTYLQNIDNLHKLGNKPIVD